MVRRPVRDRVEGITDRIPSGPLGKVGQGDVVGAGGFLAVESTRPFIELVPGVRQPGYTVVSHGITEHGGGSETHELVITAVSEDVAEFVAQYFSSPSNANFIADDLELVKTEVENKRRGYSTYKVTVEVNREI